MCSLESKYIGLSGDVNFTVKKDFEHEIKDFKVRGDKNHVDENVSDYGK